MKTSQIGTAESTARVAKMTIRKISLACGIRCCPKRASVYCGEYTSTHISDCVDTACVLSLLPNYSANKTFLHKQGAVRIFGWRFMIGTPACPWSGEYVTLEKKTIWNCLFQEGGRNSPQYFHTLSYRFRKGSFDRNIRIMLQNNYIIIICITPYATNVIYIWSTHSWCF